MNEIVDMVQTDDWILERLAENQWQTVCMHTDVVHCNTERTTDIK